MKQLDELLETWRKDSEIDRTEPGKALLDIPKMHSKYLNILSRHRLLAKEAEFKYNRMKKVKWEYYTGKADPSVYQAKPFDLKIMRTDIDKYLEADVDIQKLSQKVAYLITVVDFLDRTLRVVVNRTYTIKNAIEWRRFTSGAV